MRIKVFPNYKKLCERAAMEVSAVVKSKESVVLGLPTGGTPIGLYKQLIKRFNEGEISFKNTISFNLDEYVGISPEHPQSYHFYMNHQFFKYIDIQKENIHIPSGDLQEIELACKNYENEITKNGGIDLLILGIGNNGHIGFNEPGSNLSDKTRVVTLSNTTINANSRFFCCIDDVPRSAITMGISTIMKSRKIFLLATGWEKAEAISKFMYCEPSPDFPASFLKLHSDVTLFVDEKAASEFLRLP
jgi:glucosamine-6-phosphate deaminase